MGNPPVTAHELGRDFFWEPSLCVGGFYRMLCPPAHIGAHGAHESVRQTGDGRYDIVLWFEGSP